MPRSARSAIILSSVCLGASSYIKNIPEFIRNVRNAKHCPAHSPNKGDITGRTVGAGLPRMV